MSQIINGEKVDYTQQLAQGLPEHMLKEARDFLRREKPEWNRERVEREAIASVRAYMAQHGSGATPVCMAQPTPQPEENPEEYRPLVMAAKANGVIK